jgi:zinc protease
MQHDWLFEASKRSIGLLRSIEMGVLLGREHPWTVDAATVQQQLEKLTTGDVQEFHARNYVPDASALVVVGDVSAEQVFAAAERRFGDWQRKPIDVAVETLAPRPQQREVHAVLAGGEQTVVYMVLPAVGTAHPNFHAFGLMAQLIAGGYDSRSNQTLRHEEGATYGVHAELRGYRGGGYLRLALAVENAQLRVAVETIRNELRRLRDEPVSAAELNVARAGYLSSFELASTSGLCNWLAALQMQGLSAEWIERIETDVAAVTAEQIGSLARAAFDPDRVSVIAVGDLYRTWRHLQKLGKVNAYEIAARPPP